ncbi:MAG: hypothetical protein ACOY4Q_14150 [Bacillota bacterium]
MFIIVRSATKRKVTLGFRILVTLVILGLVVSHLYNIYHNSALSQEGWLRDDRPSGNPMRVEKSEQKVDKTQKGNILDEFVVKMQDFYLKDR